MSLKAPVPLEKLKFGKPIHWRITLDSKFLEITKQKLSLARFPEEQTDSDRDDWSQGAKVFRVKELAEYRKDNYDWEKQEKQLNEAFNHYLVKMEVPGYGPLILHFTHTRSKCEHAIPLLFSHGWPGSFVEAVKVVDKLTKPKEDQDQAFHLVAPSIPGFGFSPAPYKSGMGPEAVARAFKILMTDVLGYPWFVTQGGDFGSFITPLYRHTVPRCRPRTASQYVPRPPPTLLKTPLAYLRWCLAGLFYSDFEREVMRVRRNFETDQSGHLEQQKTRPQTLSFGFGLGATPALRFYCEAFNPARRESEKTFEAYVSMPTGVSMYVKEQLHCPRKYENGGHFSSFKQPDVFVKDLRAFVNVRSVQKLI
ncbi:Alpha/Beta hydrolase protein [Macrophomina phaseolina]|uniref:Alpha/Beta hydrolase protein n=1 Tax=Macrophomina phaseolina TaxID=35725 RepID=A0ABQ8G488_9PEZI|nr:Alpha/Beta hydrolase protein [Macrophomina phaseolina]